MAAGTYYPAFRDAADDPTHISYGDAITIREPSVDLDALVSTTQNNILCFGEEVNSGSITITGGVRDITTVNPDEFGIMEYDIDTSPGNLFDGGYVVNLNNTFNYLPAGTYYVGQDELSIMMLMEMEMMMVLEREMKRAFTVNRGK